jgi:ribose 5-phosphate isomerase RpiB
MGANGAVTNGKAWGFGQDRPYHMLDAALQAVRREGIAVRELSAASVSTAGWAKAVAQCVADGTCRGGVVFCEDPGLVCCVANKVTGLRAVPVVTVAQAVRATLSLGANLLAVEMPGRTFFEMRQVMRILCCGEGPKCPEVIAGLLRELDGDAHR